MKKKTVTIRKSIPSEDGVPIVKTKKVNVYYNTRSELAFEKARKETLYRWGLL